MVPLHRITNEPARTFRLFTGPFCVPRFFRSKGSYPRGAGRFGSWVHPVCHVLAIPLFNLPVFSTAAIPFTPLLYLLLYRCLDMENEISLEISRYYGISVIYLRLCQRVPALRGW